MKVWTWSDAIGAGVTKGLKKLYMTTTFINKSTARKAFSGEMQKSANRFFRGATSKSKNFKATELPGGQRLEFFSPAQNVGYGKR